MQDPTDRPSLRSIRRHLAVGVTLSVLLAGVLGAWGATATLSGAVIAHGQLVVASSVKKVQHPTGGVVGSLVVKEGDRVKAGDVLVRLDATQADAAMQIVVKQIDELLARQARSRAEETDAGAVTFPPELTARAGQPDIALLMEQEARLFDIRRAGRDGEKQQLRQKILEFGQEIAGLELQIVAKDRQVELIDGESKGLGDLVRRKLTAMTRLTALERDRAALTGERGQFVSAAAGARGRIAETELQILQIDHALRSEAARDLSEIRSRLSELAERRIAAQDQLARVDIRSPQDGTVHRLEVHTVGGVVRPGETLMEVVPLNDRLVVEARLSPQDVNDVRIGQRTGLRLSGISARTAPEIEGEVLQVSADVTQEARTGASYYIVRIGVEPAQLARLEGVRPVPGMPVETFIRTRERTALAYLAEPLAEQMARAFREK